MADLGEVIKVEHPDVEARGLAADDNRHVPQPGEDTVDVWKEVGYSDTENYEPEAMGVVSRGEG